MDLVPREYKKNIGQAKGISTPEASQVSFQSSKILLVFVLILFILSLLVFGGLYFYQIQLNKKITEIQKEIEQVEKEKDEELIEQIISSEERINILTNLFASHIKSSKLIKLIEESTLPQVRWTSLTFDTKNNSLELSGKAADYSVLAKQITAFEESGMKQMTISQVKLSKEGGVDFAMSMIFNGKIIR